MCPEGEGPQLPDRQIHTIPNQFILSLYFPYPSAAIRILATSSLNDGVPPDENRQGSPEDCLAWPRIDAARVYALLGESAEFAFLDVREEGLFNTGHPLTIVSAPFSHLETRMAALVPRRATRIILMDQQDDGLAERAARRLSGWGYTDISIMMDAWKAGEPPGSKCSRVSSAEQGVRRVRRASLRHAGHRCPGTAPLDGTGKDMIILDSRPYTEFHNYSLPGGIDCPGAELVHRVFDLIEREGDHHRSELRGPHPRHHRRAVLDQCRHQEPGGLRAQWHGRAGTWPARPWRAAAEPWRRRRRQRAWRLPSTPRCALSQRFGVREIDAKGLRALQADASRSLYFFDVRTPEDTRPDTSRAHAARLAAS